MKLLLLMTPGMSLEEWQSLGQLSRELNIYGRLGKKFEHIYIYSYGLRENSYCENISNIEVISKNSKLWLTLRPKYFKRHIEYIWNLYNIFKHRRLFKTLDIIKTNQFKGALFGVILKLIFKKKLVIRMGWYHSHFKKISYIEMLIEKICFHFSDFIITTNSTAQLHITNFYKIPQGRIKWIPNSIDTDKFFPDKIKKIYDIIYVGRLEREKNPLGLLNIISSIPKQSFKILFIGDGSQKKDIMLYAFEKNIDIEIITKVDNDSLCHYYNCSKVYMIPSLYEGNPKTLLEAMSCGLIVMGSNVHGIKEVINHGETGFLFDFDANFTDNNPAQYFEENKETNTIKKNARKYITKNNSLATVVEKETKVYELIMGYDY